MIRSQITLPSASSLEVADKLLTMGWKALTAHDLSIFKSNAAAVIRHLPRGKAKVLCTALNIPLPRLVKPPGKYALLTKLRAQKDRSRRLQAQRLN